MATPIWALASVELGLGYAHVQAMRHERRRQAHRQLLWQMQPGELEGLRERLAGEAPHEHRQQVARLLQLLLQRRQRLLHLREGGFLGGHVQLGDVPQCEPAPRQLERLRADRDQLLSGRELGAHRRLGRVPAGCG